MSGKGGYERTDARPVPLFIAGVALLAVMGLGILASWVVDVAFADASRTERETRHPMADYREPPPGPKLQAVPSAELVQHRARIDGLSKTYGWIDPKQGIVRIPVARAMALTARDGLPVRKEGR